MIRLLRDRNSRDLFLLCQRWPQACHINLVCLHLRKVCKNGSVGRKKDTVECKVPSWDISEAYRERVNRNLECDYVDDIATHLRCQRGGASKDDSPGSQTQ